MPLRRSFRIAAAVWRWWSSLAGAVLISLAIGWVVVQTAAGDGAVIIAKDVRPLITKAPIGGSLVYMYDQDRRENCDGEIVHTYTPSEGRARVVVTSRRPITLQEVSYYDDLRIVVGLPQTLSPGKWRFEASLDSRCSNRRRTDPIASFEIEVLP